jgi:glycosyltransferase involved in cell wall biosynthesis
MRLSVLLSVYLGTEEEELRRCLQSIDAQTHRPKEIVMVLDGPVKPEVDRFIAERPASTGLPLRILPFAENRGLGPALADGLVACQCELVARMDTDDVSLPDRFALQVSEFESDAGLSVLGGLLEEKYRVGDTSTSLVRPAPLDPDSIRRAAVYRNPLSHPTVMFRRQAVLDAGNYQPMLWFEDYDLWVRLLLAGHRCRNIDRVLVRADADRDYFQRRGGIRYLGRELVLARRFRELGFHNPLQSLRFILTRAGFRLVPSGLRSWLYFRVLRQRGGEA